MKGMVVPIDIVWIDAHFKIIAVYENVPPTSKQTYSSKTPAKYAIECMAGMSRGLGLVIGEHVKLNSPQE